MLNWFKRILGYGSVPEVIETVLAPEASLKHKLRRKQQLRKLQLRRKQQVVAILIN